MAKVDPLIKNGYFSYYDSFEWMIFDNLIETEVLRNFAVYLWLNCG